MSILLKLKETEKFASAALLILSYWNKSINYKETSLILTTATATVGLDSRIKDVEKVTGFLIKKSKSSESDQET